MIALNQPSLKCAILYHFKGIPDGRSSIEFQLNKEKPRKRTEFNIIAFIVLVHHLIKMVTF